MSRRGSPSSSFSCFASISSRSPFMEKLNSYSPVSRSSLLSVSSSCRLLSISGEGRTAIDEDSGTGKIPEPWTRSLQKVTRAVSLVFSPHSWTPPFRMVALRWLPVLPVRPQILGVTFPRQFEESSGVLSSSMSSDPSQSVSWSLTITTDSWVLRKAVTPMEPLHLGLLLYGVPVSPYFLPSSMR